MRHVELAASLMPAGTIEQYHGMATAGDVAADLGQMKVHRLAVGHREDERGTHIAGGTDGAKQIGPVIALVAWRSRPAAPFGPYAGQGALLADTRLILPPDLDGLAARVRRDDGCDQVGKVFFYAPLGSRHPAQGSAAAPICAESPDGAGARRPTVPPA